MIKNKKITIFIGNMGSGKSEIALNYTLEQMKLSAKPVKLLDLDVIKPYIRIRDIAEKLEKEGIELLMPEKKIRNADMPIIPSKIMNYFYDDRFDMVIDVGGDDRGAISIAQFKNIFNEMDATSYVVINAMRPFSNTPQRIIDTITELSRLSKLNINGIIANTHIRLTTTWDEVLKGLDTIIEASEAIHIPIKRVAIWDELLKEQEPDELNDYNILKLKLHLLFPWEN